MSDDPALDEAVKELREIGQRMNALRSHLPMNSPLQAVAFQVVAFTGEIEAQLRAARVSEGKDEP